VHMARFGARNDFAIQIHLVYVTGTANGQADGISLGTLNNREVTMVNSPSITQAAPSSEHSITLQRLRNGRSGFGFDGSEDASRMLCLGRASSSACLASQSKYQVQAAAVVRANAV
jgi:hypothetical protein